MIANLTYGISGIKNAQRAIQVTGQNLTNVNTEGYSRQRLENHETTYVYAGTNGAYTNYKGTGVDVSRLRQIRDTWLDSTYRNEVSKYSYYETQYNVLDELGNIYLNGTAGTFANTLDNLYGSISTLSQFPYSQESRASFVESAQSFLSDAQYISKQLTEMQENLNTQIITESHKANALIKDVYSLNEKICLKELNGDEANDLRDERNRKLDELAEIIPITVTENADSKAIVFSESRYIVSDLSYDQIIFEGVNGMDGYVTPRWNTGDQDVINMRKPFNEESTYNDGGSLKALMFARGNVNATYATPEKDTVNATDKQEINGCLIPSYKKDFDTLVNGVVKMINDLLAPKSKENGPYGLDDSQYVELFNRLVVPRYDETTGKYIEEDSTNPNTLYTIDNMEINEQILKDYDKLCLSISGDDSDNALIEKMIAAWKEKSIVIEESGEKVNFENYLVNYMSGMATDSGTSLSNLENQKTLIQEISNQRQAVMGSSLDDELSNLIKFQHSYTAAARVVNTVDSMIETLIMSMAV